MKGGGGLRLPKFRAVAGGVLSDTFGVLGEVKPLCPCDRSGVLPLTGALFIKGSSTRKFSVPWADPTGRGRSS